MYQELWIMNYELFYSTCTGSVQQRTGSGSTTEALLRIWIQAEFSFELSFYPKPN